MATFTFFNQFKKNLGDGVINLGSHTFKIALTNTAPSQANTVLANITQIANGNGYTTGGNTLSSVTWAETGAGTGIYQFTTANSVFTASGSGIGPFRYVVLYDDTPTSPADPLVGWLDYGSPVTVTSGNTFTVSVGSNGWFQLNHS